MKYAAFLCLFCVLLGGCARKSELDKARADLAEAQRKIEQLENERVPRSQYDVARASLRIADDRIATLEKNLNAAYDLMASQQVAPAADYPAYSTPPATAPTENTLPPSNFRLANGAYVVSNGTHVYSEESELEIGRQMKVSSPTGLMVSDPEQRVVGGDLAIKTQGAMTMTSEDGLLLTNNDGTVKFVGSTLTVKFDKNQPATNPPSDPKSPPPAAPTRTEAATTSP